MPQLVTFCNLLCSVETLQVCVWWLCQPGDAQHQTLFRYPGLVCFSSPTTTLHCPIVTVWLENQELSLSIAFDSLGLAPAYDYALFLPLSSTLENGTCRIKFQAVICIPSPFHTIPFAGSFSRVDFCNAVPMKPLK